MSAAPKVTVYPNEWKNGSTPNRTSRSERPSISLNASTFDPMLRWLSITPLGSPLEPDVKMIVITSSGRSRVSPRHRSSSHDGTSHVWAAAANLSKSLVCWGKSSRYTNSAST